MRRFHPGLIVTIGGVALAGCGSETDDSVSALTAAHAAQGAGVEAGDGPGDDSNEDADIALDAEGKPIDYLTYGAGAFPIQFDQQTQGNAAAAVLDGRLGYASLSNSPTGPEQPISFKVELPAQTTFAVFGIPPQSSFGCCSGTHINSVTVEGSASSPDEGYVQLARFQVDPDIHDDNQLFPADRQTPVRWVRVTLEGRQIPDPDDYRGTAFTDLLGFGTQERVEVADDHFSGRWLTGGGAGGGNGNRLELIQDGALVTGCGTSGGNNFAVSGGVENGLLKYVVGNDTVPIVAVINSEDQLSGAMIGRSFGRVIGEPGGAPTSCTPGEEPPPNPVGTALDQCRAAIVYGINFDVDSSEIRPDAEPALFQILAALAERPGMSVVIEGHTDSDASDQHNLDLSQRRADSVAAWLVDNGAGAGHVTPLGKGEAEPIADNETSAGKAANRRVEVEPTC